MFNKSRILQKKIVYCWSHEFFNGSVVVAWHIKRRSLCLLNEDSSINKWSSCQNSDQKIRWRVCLPCVIVCSTRPITKIHLLLTLLFQPIRAHFLCTKKFPIIMTICGRFWLDYLTYFCYSFTVEIGFPVWTWRVRQRKMLAFCTLPYWLTLWSSLFWDPL